MTSQENILRIQVIQSKLLKVLTNKRIRHSTNKLHNELSILKVEDIIKQEILTFVHNYRNNKLPDVFNNYFLLKKDIQTIQTRNIENQFVIPYCRTNIGEGSLKVKGPKSWNMQSNLLKKNSHLKSFRNTWKKTIFPYPTD